MNALPDLLFALDREGRIHDYLSKPLDPLSVMQRLCLWLRRTPQEPAAILTGEERLM